MNTDGFIPGDGFYFDDFSVKAFDEETLDNTEFGATAMVVYPNPFGYNGFSVKAPSETISEISTLQITDVLGRTIEMHFTKENNTLLVKETAALNTGIYFIRFLNTKGSIVAVKKLVKL
jgi:hypothetical protein